MCSFVVVFRSLFCMCVWFRCSSSLFAACCCSLLFVVVRSVLLFAVSGLRFVVRFVCLSVVVCLPVYCRLLFLVACCSCLLFVSVVCVCGSCLLFVV